MGGTVADSGIPFISSIEGEYRSNMEMAKATEADARFNAEQRRTEAKRLLGEQIAAFGMSGVELDGTPREIMEADQKTAELEAMNIIYSGKMQSSLMKRQAALSKYKGYESMAMTGLTLGMSSGMFKSTGSGVAATPATKQNLALNYTGIQNKGIA